MAAATSRLRRTFAYPTESDEEDAVEEGMDEQDQETLLSTLSTQDTSTTQLYTTLLLILPLAPIILYLPRLLTTSPTKLLATLAAIVSLLASAFTLYYLPLPPVRVTILNTADFSSSSSSGTAKGKSIARTRAGGKAASPPAERVPVPWMRDEVAEVVARYAVPVNAGMCVLLALLEMGEGRSWSEGMMIGGGYVPGFILSVVLFARRELRVVDLGELERLRYRTKGG